MLEITIQIPSIDQTGRILIQGSQRPVRVVGANATPLTDYECLLFAGVLGGVSEHVKMAVVNEEKYKRLVAPEKARE